jgi:prepilin-type N-terminal cleavage/methylation domain-containing protein
MKKHISHVCGFTMIEVMIASSVLLLFIGGFFASFVVGIRALDMSVNHYRANSIARNRIQRARSFAYESLPLLSESETAVDRFGNVDISGDFRRTTVISTNTPTAPHTVLIQVGVRFPLRDNQFSEKVEVENLIAVRM